jgi:LacI family transcriptional regulator
MTLDEVAKIAGVSKSTVSRVINNSSRVAPDVSRLVLDTMQKIGYQVPARRPGPKAIGRKGIRTGNILLLMLGMSAGEQFLGRGYPELLNGIENATRESGLKLIFSGIDRDGVIPVALDEDEVDGVLLFGHSHSLSQAAGARLKDIPTVGLMRGFDELRGQIDRVLYDNAMVGPMAADYLAKRGHKCVGFWSIDPLHPAFIPRLRDFTRVAQEIGLEVVSLVADHKPETFRQELAQYQALSERLIAAPGKITGLFVAADYQLPQLYHSLELKGMRPGKDLDFISCDNAPFFLDHLTPRPASIDINLKLVGRRGVEQLLWRMANPAICNRSHLLIEPVLVPAMD